VSTFLTKILLATDGSEDAALAARAAVDLSSRADSELYVIHAWHCVPSAHFEAFLRSQLEQEARKVLDAQVERIEEAGGTVAGAYLREGTPVDGILDLAEELEPDLLVIGSRGLGSVQRLLMGSVSEGIVHGTAFPVLAMRGGERAWPPERIVVGDDGSDEAKGAEELAAGIGELYGAKGLLVRAYPKLPEVDVEERRSDARLVEDELRREQRSLTDRAREIEVAFGLRYRVEIATGDPASSLLRAAEEGAAEKALIAVGSRGLGVVRRVRLGSVSTKVLHAAEGPILVYPRQRS
jgi:nucleotide-binding universal stress UspA family protein